MPDLNIESAWTCDTNVDWATSVIGSKGDAYTVRWGQLSFREANRQRCEYGWTCTCKGFGFLSVYNVIRDGGYFWRIAVWWVNSVKWTNS